MVDKARIDETFDEMDKLTETMDKLQEEMDALEKLWDTLKKVINEEYSNRHSEFEALRWKRNSMFTDLVEASARGELCQKDISSQKVKENLKA